MAAQKSSMARTKMALEFSNTEKICDLDKLKMVATKAIFVQGRVMGEVEIRKEVTLLFRNEDKNNINRAK